MKTIFQRRLDFRLSGDEPTSLSGGSVASLHPRDADVPHRLAGHALPFTMARAFAAPDQAAGDFELSAVHLLCTRGLVRLSSYDAGGTPRFTVLNPVRHLLAETAAAAAPAGVHRTST